MADETKKGAEKAGYKTTEFWLAMAAVVVGLLLESGVVTGDGFLPQGLGLIASALASLGYSYSRAKIKEKQIESK